MTTAVIGLVLVVIGFMALAVAGAVRNHRARTAPEKVHAAAYAEAYERAKRNRTRAAAARSSSRSSG